MSVQSLWPKWTSPDSVSTETLNSQTWTFRSSEVKLSSSVKVIILFSAFWNSIQKPNIPNFLRAVYVSLFYWLVKWVTMTSIQYLGTLPHRRVLQETAGNTGRTRSTAHGTALHYCWQSSQLEQSHSYIARRLRWLEHSQCCFMTE